MINLYTDGGSDNRGGGASACIVQIGQTTRCFSFLLGDATNNECEIFAVLIGLAYIQDSIQNGECKEPDRKVLWVSDSEYSLKSATQYILTWQKNGWRTSQKDPVKNQGLWKTYLQMTNGLTIMPEHVRGHTGHPENEACDLAVNWIRKNKDICDGTWIAGSIDIGDSKFPQWLMKDERTLLAQIRSQDTGDGLNLKDFVSQMAFSLAEKYLFTPFKSATHMPQIDSDSLSKERIRITKSYLKKMKELDTQEQCGDTQYLEAIRLLQEWLSAR